MTPSNGVQSYLAAVRAALADLPAAERDDLLAEVEASLVEAASETGGDVSLGPPEEFAAELRAAAGLHEAPAAGSRVPSRAVLVARRLVRHPRVQELRRLAPIWWVVRAYVVVAVIALLIGAAWSTAYPIVPRLDSGLDGLLLILGATILSIWLGLKLRLRPIVNVVLLLAAVPVLVHLAHRPPTRQTVFYLPAAQQYAPGITYDGVPLRNVYPFTRSGHLLHDVLLYTGSGVPMNVTGQAEDPQRRLLRAKGGKLVLNAFPIRATDSETAARSLSAPLLRWDVADVLREHPAVALEILDPVVAIAERRVLDL